MNFFKEIEKTISDLEDLDSALEDLNVPYRPTMGIKRLKRLLAEIPHESDTPDTFSLASLVLRYGQHNRRSR